MFYGLTTASSVIQCANTVQIRCLPYYFPHGEHLGSRRPAMLGRSKEVGGVGGVGGGVTLSSSGSAARPPSSMSRHSLVHDMLGSRRVSAITGRSQSPTVMCRSKCRARGAGCLCLKQRITGALSSIQRTEDDAEYRLVDALAGAIRMHGLFSFLLPPLSFDLTHSDFAAHTHTHRQAN